MDKISDMPLSDRPRERLAELGSAALSDMELMCVILGSGCRGKGVKELANEVLEVLDCKGPERIFHKLSEIPGIGFARATQIAACLEFVRRRVKPEGVRISSPKDVLPLLSHYDDRKQEHLIVVSLNGANEVIATRCVAIGLLDSAPVHPREVFADIIVDRAAGIILAHNHPSGDTTPSLQDIDATKKIKAAGNVLKIKVLDHIIFSQRGYYSFLENGKL